MRRGQERFVLSDCRVARLGRRPLHRQIQRQKIERAGQGPPLHLEASLGRVLDVFAGALFGGPCFRVGIGVGLQSADCFA